MSWKTALYECELELDEMRRELEQTKKQLAVAVTALQKVEISNGNWVRDFATTTLAQIKAFEEDVV